jgi:glycyl-tRNA synthetase beta chain
MIAILEAPESELATQVETATLGVPSPDLFPLLLEIGCEEIPARFLADAQKQFGERLRQALDEARLLLFAEGEGDPAGQPRLTTYSTPRRLVAHVAKVLATQPDQSERVTGPPVKVAFDAAGKPTRAAESFAQKNGVRVEDLLKISTPKGEYLQAQKVTPGREASVVLREVLPGVITGLAFPKSMYWEPSKTRFVRPIRWIVALLGEGDQAQVVRFEVASVRSGNSTQGHRALGTAPVSLSGFDDYARKLRDAQVVFDPEKRRAKVLDEIEILLKFPGFSILSPKSKILRVGAGHTDPDERLEAVRSHIRALPDEYESDFRLVADRGLEEWVVNSTEYPHAILGTFEQRFLKLPREILITVMRDHQKYFAVESGSGELQSCFVTVLNVPGDPNGTIRAGHERVLTARFSDAEFFWNADQKVPLRDRVPMLDRVTYQAKLGSYGDKVRRMEAIANQLCSTLQGQGKMTRSEADHALRAIHLCKCDLTTQMVQEFTELQGVVGGLYAAHQEEPQEVADAIYDHYKPAGLDEKLPRTIVGAAVSLADKVDSVIAGFAVGLEPSGSSDPFGLRRAGNGIIKLAVEALPGLDLLPLVSVFTEGGAADLRLPQRPSLEVVSGFLRERVEYHLAEAGRLRYDTVRAVVHSYLGWAVPSQALQRGAALERVRDTEDFAALAIAAKRAHNILKKSATLEDWGAAIGINESLLTDGPERDLYEVYQASAATLEDLEARSAFEEAFRVLARLRPAVDRFFDKVLVMDQNPDIRANRLQLLGRLRDFVFSRLADLSQIEGNTLSSGGASTLGRDAGDTL